MKKYLQAFFEYQDQLFWEKDIDNKDERIDMWLKSDECKAMNYIQCCVSQDSKEAKNLEESSEQRKENFNNEVEQLVKEQGRWLMVNTDLDVSTIVDFEQEFN